MGMTDLQRIKQAHESQMEQLRNGKMIMYSAHPKDVQWLIDQAEQVNGLIKLVNYHQQKQKEAEDENEPYRHQNNRYRELLTSPAMKGLIRLEDKGQFLPSDKREQFADLKWAIKALGESDAT